MGALGISTSMKRCLHRHRVSYLDYQTISACGAFVRNFEENGYLIYAYTEDVSNVKCSRCTTQNAPAMLSSSRTQCTNDQDDRHKGKIKKDSILPCRRCSLYRPKYAQRNEKKKSCTKIQKKNTWTSGENHKDMQQYIARNLISSLMRADSFNSHLEGEQAGCAERMRVPFAECALASVRDTA